MAEPIPRRSLTRCYRILGLPPGAPLADIKHAYRDLAQVWHPDRFAHDPRLRDKAQENLKRINDAYQTLQAADLSDQPARHSRLSTSFRAILGIGDMVKTGSFRQPTPRRAGPRVLVVEDDQRTRRNRARRRLVLWLLLLAVGLTVATLLLW
jgi:curved DNA-binding protein CbpA